jgi:hypothetical protein
VAASSAGSAAMDGLVGIWIPYGRALTPARVWQYGRNGRPGLNEA